jgi:hypothetical protein
MSREGDLSTEAGQAPSLLYLYAVLPADTDADHALRERQIPGLEPYEPLFPLSEGGLVAAVSRVSAVAFDEPALNELVADVARLAPLAVRHEEAVSWLARLAPALIPMHFGTVYRGIDGVVGLLQERGLELHELLAHLDRAQEWGLKVFVEPDELHRWVAQQSVTLREADAAIARSSPGRAYLLQKQRERLLAPELARVVEECTREILAELESHSRAVRRDEVVATPLETGSLLLKASFLVPVAQVAALRQASDDLARSYHARGLRLELTGPWAPYSFVREENPALRVEA